MYPAGCYKDPLSPVTYIPSRFQWLNNDLNSRMNIWAKSGLKRTSSGSQLEAIFLYIVSQVILGKPSNFILQEFDKYVYPIAIHIFTGIWPYTIDLYSIVYFFIFCKRMWRAFAKQHYGPGTDAVSLEACPML